MTAGEIALYYNESFLFLQKRKTRQAAQLVLMNNLNRGDENISSTLLLTLFDRTLSASYDDKLQIKFLPSQGILQEQLNSYNILAQSDYIEMGKSKLDYDWLWDTLFFGRGYMETLRFDKKRKIMQPHVINPLNFGYDPYFETPQEWRYYWKWITKTKWEIQKLIKAGVIEGVTLDQLPTGIDPYLWQYKVRRDQAKEAVQPAIESVGADIYQLLEFYGHDENGKKCVYWLDKNMSHILMKDELKLGDGEEIIAPDGTVIDQDSKWPIVVKEAFREPHSSIVFSVADLLEDKHRAKSVLLNLAFIAAKDRANPLYWYNPDKIKDISQFFNRQISQHIPTDGPDAVGPINTEDPMSAGLIQFISMLTQEANDPMGTGQVGQPMAAKGDKTATHDAINQQMNDMATSLQSKVLQFGEAEFWSHWFHRYAKNANSLGFKMANIVGVKGVKTQEIDLKDFNTKFPPGVMVYSAKEAEYKESILRRDLMQILPDLAATMDGDGIRNFYKHIFFPKFLQDPSLIDIMYPKTLDEMKAEDENELLAKNEMVMAQETDNHTTHIYTHHMVQPKTWATWMHIAMHEEMLAQGQAGGQQGGQGGQEEQRVSQSISYKDLPPTGQVQMAAQAGIQIEEGDAQEVQKKQAEVKSAQAQSNLGNKPKKVGESKTPSPNKAVSPMKSMSTSKPLIK